MCHYLITNVWINLWYRCNELVRGDLTYRKKYSKMCFGLFQQSFYIQTIIPVIHKSNWREWTGTATALTLHNYFINKRSERHQSRQQSSEVLGASCRVSPHNVD